MEIPIYTVDSFTNEAFKGNPAGVCLLDVPLEKEVMQSIAQEVYLSETAFVLPMGDGFHIQYFSPINEIPLCGHATLAAAKILFEERGLTAAHFTTNSQVSLHTIQSGDHIAMEFPSYTTLESEASDQLINALGINELIDTRYNAENNMLMLVIPEDELMNLTPDFPALLLSHDSINGVLVTSESSGLYDFTSRYFWPWSGGNEDPVTGATHTFMAPYWGKRLQKASMKSFQASKRTGFMEVELKGNDKIVIKGSAVIVIKGTLTL